MTDSPRIRAKTLHQPNEERKARIYKIFQSLCLSKLKEKEYDEQRRNYDDGNN
jgi:hypothetical protein